MKWLYPFSKRINTTFPSTPLWIRNIMIFFVVNIGFGMLGNFDYFLGALSGGTIAFGMIYGDIHYHSDRTRLNDAFSGLYSLDSVNYNDFLTEIFSSPIKEMPAPEWIDEETIPIDECEENVLYRINARNANLGIFKGKHTKEPGFIIIRKKFGRRYLDFEYHWDNGRPFGTASPKRVLDSGLSHIPMKNQNRPADSVQEKVFSYLDEMQNKFNG